MLTDPILLKRFVEEGSEPAFRELVTQRIHFVYATALRQVGGDSHLAGEVAQSVFLDLARKARALAGRPNLVGWLYTSTRFAAAKALRARSRRMNRETEAHAMQEILSDRTAAETNWRELRPVLDAAMHELGEKDREAILLRYFEGLPLAGVGAAIGAGENAARMRVDRALEKLRVRLARHGITSTAAALGAALSAQPVVTAPAGLASAVAGSSLVGAGGAGVLGNLLSIVMKQKIASVAAAALLAGGLYIAADTRLQARLTAEDRRQDVVLSRFRDGNRELAEQNRQLAAERATRAARMAAPPAVDPLARLRPLAALIKGGSLGTVFWMPDATSRSILTPAAIALFALTPGEVVALEEALKTAEREIGALGAAGATGLGV